jgi:pimeloyl-ACP methyl ester carboxylesterase
MELGRPERQTQAQGMLQNLLKRIGEKCILLGEGSGATMAWLAADVEPDLVACVVAVEPSGPPFGNSKIDKTGENDQIRIFSHRIRYSGTTRRYGLADIPLTYDPPFDAPVDFFDDFGLGIGGGSSSDRADLAAETKKSIFNLKQVTCPDDPRKTAWLQTVASIPDAIDENGNPYPPNRQPGRIRELMHIRKAPQAIITAHASTHMVYDWATVAFLRQAGCDVSWLKLQEHNILGNGHLMFLETNSNDIADLIHTWITEKLFPHPAGLPSPAPRPVLAAPMITTPVAPPMPFSAPTSLGFQPAVKLPTPVKPPTPHLPPTPLKGPTPAAAKAPSVTGSDAAADEMSLLVAPSTITEPAKDTGAKEDDLHSADTPKQTSPSSSVMPPASTIAPTLTTTGSGLQETPSMTTISAAVPAPVATPGWPRPDVQMKDFLETSYGPNAQNQPSNTPSQSNIFETNLSPYYTPAEQGRLSMPALNNTGTNMAQPGFDPRQAAMSTSFAGSQFNPQQTQNLPAQDPYTQLPYSGNYNQTALSAPLPFFNQTASFSAGISPALNTTTATANPNLLSSSQLQMPTFGQMYMATYPTEQELSARMPQAAPMLDNNNFALQSFTLPSAPVGATVPQTHGFAPFSGNNVAHLSMESNDGKNDKQQKPDGVPTNLGAPLEMNRPMTAQGDGDDRGLPRSMSGIAQMRTSYPGGFNAAILGTAAQQAQPQVQASTQQPAQASAQQQTQRGEPNHDQGEAGFPYFLDPPPTPPPNIPIPFPVMAVNPNVGPPMSSGPPAGSGASRSASVMTAPPRALQPAPRGRGKKTGTAPGQRSTSRKPFATLSKRIDTGAMKREKKEEDDVTMENTAEIVANAFFMRQDDEPVPAQQAPTNAARPEYQSAAGSPVAPMPQQAFFQPMNPLPQYRSLQQPAYAQGSMNAPTTPQHERTNSGGTTGDGPHLQQQVFTHARTPPSPSPGPRQARASDAAPADARKVGEQGQGSPSA